MKRLLLLLGIVLCLEQVAYSMDAKNNNLIIAHSSTGEPLEFVLMGNNCERKLTVAASKNVFMLNECMQRNSYFLSLTDCNESELRHLSEYIIQRHNQKLRSYEKKLNFDTSQVDTDPRVAWNKYCIQEILDVSSIKKLISIARFLFKEEDDAPLWLLDSWYHKVNSLHEQCNEQERLLLYEPKDNIHNKCIFALGKNKAFMLKNGLLYQASWNSSQDAFDDLKTVDTLIESSINNICIDRTGSKLCLQSTYCCNDSIKLIKHHILDLVTGKQWEADYYATADYSQNSSICFEYRDGLLELVLTSRQNEGKRIVISGIADKSAQNQNKNAQEKQDKSDRRASFFTQENIKKILLQCRETKLFESVEFVWEQYKNWILGSITIALFVFNRADRHPIMGTPPRN